MEDTDMNKKRYNQPAMTIFTLKLDNPLLSVSDLKGENQLQWSDDPMEGEDE